MIFNLEITFKDRLEDGSRTTHSKTYHVDSDDIPLIFLEATSSGSVGPLREALSEFLDLTDAESRQLTVRHIKQIGAAMKEAQDDPKKP